MFQKELGNVKLWQLLLVGAGAAALVFGGLWATGNLSPDKEQQIVAVADGAPAFCQDVASMPSGLMDAVGNATAGAASDEDREVIAKVVSQLRDAAKDSSASRELKAQFADVAGLLDKLANNETLSANEATSLAKMLQTMGKGVMQACSAS